MVSRSLERVRGGFTTIELMVALALLALVLLKAVIIMDATSSYSSDEATAIAVENQARQTLDRIAYAIMGSDRGTLDPGLESPSFSARIRYTVSLGVQDGEVVWDDPEEIATPPATSDLVWSKNPGAADERRVLWSRIVAPLLQGELQNGVDDNANGLIDEQGLTFVLDGNSVTITLTMAKPNRAGVPVPRTVTTTVTCRRPE